MHAIQLFVEDQLNEPYEILAAKAMGVDIAERRGERSRAIRAARVNLGELTDVSCLLDLAQRSQRSGFRQVVFVSIRSRVYL